MSFLATEGVIQVATGDRHQDEAISSVRRIRRFLNSRPMILVTDNPDRVPSGLFDKVLLHPRPLYSYRDKIMPLLRLPFKRTLFLDTDIELLSPVDDIFEMLKSIDFVGSHAPVRWSDWKSDFVPEGFTEINSGVMGIRRSLRQRSLIRYWLKLYDRIGIDFDQATLRESLWWAVSHRSLRIWVLPPEYNLRTPKPWMTGSGMPVKILHGRLPEEQRKYLHHYLNNNIHEFRCSSAFPTLQNQKILPYTP